MDKIDATTSAPKNMTLILQGLSVCLVTLYLFAASFSAIALMVLVPVSEQDIRYASWLHYTMYHYPGVAAGWLFGLFMLVLAFSNLVMGRTLDFLVGLSLAACAVVWVSDGVAFRNAVLDDVARVGCFSYEGRECLQMLGIDDPSAPLMYQEPTKSNGYSSHRLWYAEVRSGLPNPAPIPVPGLAILMAPFDLARVDELKARLESQRSEVNAVRASHGLEKPFP